MADCSGKLHCITIYYTHTDHYEASFVVSLLVLQDRRKCHHRGILEESKVLYCKYRAVRLLISLIFVLSDFLSVTASVMVSIFLPAATVKRL
jgi:hypothetical protein